MNDLLKHVEYVRANWRDRTASRALLDHCRELPVEPTPSAIRFVASIIFEARRTEELARAVEVLKGEGAHAVALKEAVAMCVLWSAHSPFTVIVKAGRARPLGYPDGQFEEDGEPPAMTVLVGARFVLVLDRLRREVLALESETHSNLAGALFDI